MNTNYVEYFSPSSVSVLQVAPEDLFRMAATQTTSLLVKQDGQQWVKSPRPDVEVVKGVELHELIFENIKHYADLPALSCPISGETLTYSRFHKEALGFGAGLIEAGFKKGEVFGICLPNFFEYPVAILGCWCAGLTLSTINQRLPEEEIVRHMKLVQPRVVVTNTDFLDAIIKSKEGNPHLRTIILVGSSKEEALEKGCLSFAQMVLESDPETVTFSTGKDTDTTEAIAWLNFSSGTTGPPKLAQMSHAQIATCFVQYTQEDAGPTKGYLEIGEQERIIAFFPFFHTGGLFLSIVTGMTQGSHAMMMPQFEPDLFLRIMREHRPTCLHLVTPLVAHIAKCDDFTAKELECVHTIFAGGAPIGSGIIQQLLEKAGRYMSFMELYGMSEMLFTHTLPPSSKNRKVGSCGVCMPSTISKIVDVDTGEDLGPHQNGEIWCKPPAPVKGYFQNEALTRKFVDENNWVRMGDIGYYDDEGYFYVVDRIIDLIKVDSTHVAPGELEKLIKNHPKVADCVVIGVPSEEHGEVPRAYIIRKEKTLTEKEVNAYINPLVATHQQLKGGVEFVKTIPKNPTGKNLRREMREDYKRKFCGGSSATKAASA